MEQRTADTLNRDWRQSGVYWAEDKVAADKVAADKVAADKVAADKVAADKVAADKVAADKGEKVTLLAEIQKLVDAKKVEKMPNPNMGVVKLKEIIENAKLN
jgi:membrane protein involved in colicin uptake